MDRRINTNRTAFKFPPYSELLEGRVRFSSYQNIQVSEIKF